MKYLDTKLLAICGLLLFSVMVKANPDHNSDVSDHTVHTLYRNQLEEGLLRNLNIKCSQRNNHSCIILKLILNMNSIFKKSTILLSRNVEIVQKREGDIENELEQRILLPRRLQSDEEALGSILTGRVWQFIRSRVLRFKIHKNADIVVTSEPRGNLNIGLSISFNSIKEEGRGKIKNIGHIIAAIAMKIGIFGIIFIKGILLLAKKALIVSKIALILTFIIVLKKFLEKKHVTYEVVPHQHSHTTHPSHDTYSSGWSRAFQSFLEGLANVPEKFIDSHSLAYSKQKRSRYSESIE